MNSNYIKNVKETNKMKTNKINDTLCWFLYGPFFCESIYIYINIFSLIKILQTNV